MAGFAPEREMTWTPDPDENDSSMSPGVVIERENEVESNGDFA